MTRTTMPVFIVIAIGVAGMMLGMSGFSAAWGADPPKTEAAQEEVNESADLGPTSKPISGPVSSSDSSTVGLIASGLGSLTDFAGSVAHLPQTLIALNFPMWFSVPLGSVAAGLVGIGIIEFAINREWT